MAVTQSGMRMAKLKKRVKIAMAHPMGFMKNGLKMDKSVKKVHGPKMVKT